MRVSWHDLEMTFDYVSSDGGGANRAYLCKETGHIYWHSDVGDNFEELPDDVDDSEKYTPIPDRRELGLGTPLVFQFVRQFLPNDYDKVRAIFSKRGAYARFKDLLEYRRMVDQWREFENKAEEKALRDWCALHSIEIEVDRESAAARPVARRAALLFKPQEVGRRPSQPDVRPLWRVIDRR